MPVLVQTVNDRMLSRLDSESSERYTFNEDIKPAINGAVEWIVAELNAAFAAKKLTPEALRDLVKVGVWQTNSYSRVSYDPALVGFPLWSILGVFPKPQVVGGSPIAQTDKAKSVFRNDISFLKSKFSASRLNFEEWNINVDNAFEPGNEMISGTLTDYAYLDFADYSSTAYTGASGVQEIEIRPAIPNELVGIAYLKFPTNVSLITDSLEFPESMTELIVGMSLKIIAVKQGDHTTTYLFGEAESQKLIALLK